MAGRVEQGGRRHRTDINGVDERGCAAARRDADLVAVADVAGMGGREVLVKERCADERPVES